MSEDRSGEAGECKVAAVTGAFGYSGKYIARRLLDRGYRVVNLTGHPDRPDPFDGEVEVAGRRFDDPDSLARSMEGAAVLFNTYWVRFARGGETFEKAVENSVTLFHAAKKAGVRRVVHTSIANPSEDSPLGYYRGKALVEKALQDSGLSHAILRPTVIFGKEDILINNIAWSLRKLPFFAIPGDGSYKIQPVFVEDFADLAIQAAESEESTVQDAVGPEVFTFDKLVRLVAGAIGRPARLVHVPPTLVFWATRAVGFFVKDVILTREEIAGLMDNLLVSDGPATGQTRLSEWLKENAGSVGVSYASEVGRHFR